MNNHIPPTGNLGVSTLSTLEPSFRKTVNGGVPPTDQTKKSRKQRVTITLPVSLLERLRNAVYWTGHGPLARLIADALDDAVTHMEASNGQTFPQRLAPLKRGRPRTKTSPASLSIASGFRERMQ